HLHHIHRGVFNHPKLQVLCEDGLSFITKNTGTFYHIVLDLPDPVGPAEQLYEDIFLLNCKKRLSPNGTLNIHTGSPWAHPERVRNSFQRLSGIFQNVTLWTVFIPLYGTLWSMCVCSGLTRLDTVCSDEIDHRLKNRGILDLQYYSGLTHTSLIALPPFIDQMIR
ncbi:MAG: hypothetical protein ACKO5X_00090, partial [Limnohabitans sp.]